MPNESWVDVGCNKSLDIVLRCEEDRLHVRHDLSQEMLEISVDLDRDIFG